MRVAILDDIHHAYEGTDGVRRLRERADVRIFTAAVEAPAALREFDALVANRERTRFTGVLLEQLPKLRIIAQTGNHAHHIDFDTANRLGIIVAKASSGFSLGAAELAIGLAIAVMRQIPAVHDALTRGHWTTPCTPVLHGKTLGIVGLGRVGRHVARLAVAFGMRVLAWSPRLTDERASLAGAEYRLLDDLLRESDVVSLHAALTPQSRHLLDARRIALMKPRAYFVNTARAALVDGAALLRALQEQRLAGAALDVFDEEPLPADHPLTRLPNVVLTPHIGWPTDEGYARFAADAADVLLAHLDGRDVPRFAD